MRSRASNDDRIKRHMGRTLEVAHYVLSSLISSLSVNSSGENTIRLLSFYSDFLVGIAGIFFFEVFSLMYLSVLTQN